MSWQPISFWTLRCDGDTTHGQCDQLLYAEPDALVVPHAWNRQGAAHEQPVLFTGGTHRQIHERWIAEHGWLKTDARLLCPKHVAALEKQAQADLEGLPFDEEVTRE